MNKQTEDFRRQFIGADTVITSTDGCVCCKLCDVLFSCYETMLSLKIILLLLSTQSYARKSVSRTVESRTVANDPFEFRVVRYNNECCRLQSVEPSAHSN